MKMLMIILMVLLAGCCGSREVIAPEEHTVQVPTLHVDTIWASNSRIVADSLKIVEMELAIEEMLTELTKYSSASPRVETVFRDRVLGPRDYTARHMTPSADTVDVLFHLAAKSYFSFDDRRGPFKFSELDTTHSTIVEEFPFLSKLGLVAMSAVGTVILLLVTYLVLKAKGMVKLI